MILQCVRFVVEHFGLRRSDATAEHSTTPAINTDNDRGAGADSTSSYDEHIAETVASTANAVNTDQYDIDNTKEVDGGKSDVTSNLPDSTEPPTVSIVAENLASIDATDGDSGIGSPTRNVPASLVEEAN